MQMLVYKNLIIVAFLSIFLINCGSSDTTEAEEIVTQNDTPTAENDILIVEETAKQKKIRLKHKGETK